MLKIIKKEPETRNAEGNHKHGIEGKMKTKKGKGTVIHQRLKPPPPYIIEGLYPPWPWLPYNACPAVALAPT
jgi:hypothetical protein